MKTNLGTFIIGCCCYALSFSGFGQTDTTYYNNETSGSGSSGGMTEKAAEETAIKDLHSSMKKNMKEMMDLKMTGQVDEDFAMMMATHHQGAIELSRTYLKVCKSPRLREIAEKSMNKQRKEADKLRTFAKQHKEHTTDVATMRELMAPMQKMMRAGQSMKKEDNIDSQFATMIIEHHKAGIEMSEVELRKGTHVELKNLARKIKEDQTKEIQELESWIKENK